MSAAATAVLWVELALVANADPDNLGTVDDPDLQKQYAAEAQRMEDVHDPDDSI